MRHRRTGTPVAAKEDAAKTAAAANARKQRPDMVGARTASTDKSSGTRMTTAEAAAWIEAGQEITPPKVLERLARHQQFVLGNVTIVGLLLAAAAGAAAVYAVAHPPAFADDFPYVAVGALATLVVAGLAVLAALLSRRVPSQTIDENGAMTAQKYYTNELLVRPWLLRIATSLLFVGVVLALATAVTAGVLALVDDADQADGDPQNRAALSATVGGDGAVTVYLTGSVADLDDDEYLVVQVTSAFETVISGNVYPDDDGTAELASEARVPAGSSEAEAVISVMRGDEVVGTPYTLETSFSAPVAGE